MKKYPTSIFSNNLKKHSSELARLRLPIYTFFGASPPRFDTCGRRVEGLHGIHVDGT